MAVHGNLGLTLLLDGDTSAPWLANYGASAVWLAHPHVNALVEVSGLHTAAAR
jgi:hypothetical protein